MQGWGGKKKKKSREPEISSNKKPFFPGTNTSLPLKKKKKLKNNEENPSEAPLPPPRGQEMPGAASPNFAPLTPNLWGEKKKGQCFPTTSEGWDPALLTHPKSFGRREGDGSARRSQTHFTATAGDGLRVGLGELRGLSQPS